MLNNIPWQGYWTSLALLSAGYYVGIYWRYFRKDFKYFLRGQRQGVTSPRASPAVANFLKDQIQPALFDEPEGEFSIPTESTEQAVYACMDELNAYFENAKKTKCAKEELRFSVQRILSKYPVLKTSEYKGSITNVIQTEAEHHCSVHLSAEELLQVWLA